MLKFKTFLLMASKLQTTPLIGIMQLGKTQTSNLKLIKESTTKTSTIRVAVVGNSMLNMRIRYGIVTNVVVLRV